MKLQLCARMLFLLLVLTGCVRAVQEQAIFSQRNNADIPAQLFRVAVIGAGASGSSAAYFLANAREKLEKGSWRDGNTPQSLRIDVYERSGRIGGRAMTIHPFNDTALDAIEIGASIFASSNRNMHRAVKEFGLRTDEGGMLKGSVAIWDGSKFVIANDGSTWSQAKLYWRYGLSPSNAMKLMKKAVNQFVKVYSPKYLHRVKAKSRRGPRTESGFPWRTPAEWKRRLGLRDMTRITARDYFIGKGISALFVDEGIDAATRANYAQDVNELHAFGGLVSLAATGSHSVRGGNEQVFVQMLNRSGASVRMGPAGHVSGLMKIDTAEAARAAGLLSVEEEQRRTERGMASEPMWWLGTRDGHGALYDAVLIASPWQDAGITLLNTDRVVPVYEYRKLHVSIVLTTADEPSAAYFGKSAGRVIPRTIFTTYVDAESHGGEIPFLSLAYVGEVRGVKGASAASRTPLYAVKIFSLQPLSDSDIDTLLGKGTVRWVYRHTWDAYPLLRPTDKFAPFEVDRNLYNINAMERWISTMETSTLAAKNTVALLLQKWFGPHFVNGEKCAWDAPPEWAGWGCNGA